GRVATQRASPPSAGSTHRAASGLSSGSASGSGRPVPKSTDPSGRKPALPSPSVERVSRRGARPPSGPGAASISHRALRKLLPSGAELLTGATRRVPSGARCRPLPRRSCTYSGSSYQERTKTRAPVTRCGRTPRRGCRRCEGGSVDAFAVPAELRPGPSLPQVRAGLVRAGRPSPGRPLGAGPADGSAAARLRLARGQGGQALLLGLSPVFTHQIGDHRDERGVRARAQGSLITETALLGGLACLDVEVELDLHVVGDEPVRDDHDGGHTLVGQFLDAVVDVGLQPGLAGRTAAALVDDFVGVLAVEALHDQAGDGLELVAVGARGPVGLPRSTAALGHLRGDGVRGEEQARTLALVLGKPVEGVPGVLGQRSDEPGVVVEGTHQVDLGGTLAQGCSGPVDVLEVGGAAGPVAVGGGGYREYTSHPVLLHLLQRVGEQRGPEPVAPVDRQVDTGRLEVRGDGGEQIPALLVDRADPSEEEVVFPDLSEPLPGDVASTSDVLQERDDLVLALRATERDEQKRVVRPHAPHETSSQALTRSDLWSSCLCSWTLLPRAPRPVPERLW